MSVDAAGSSAIGAAVGWLDGLVLGTLASVIAIVAVAAIGLLLLAGRLDLRTAGRVIIGCFIIFGASTIAAGIMSAIEMNKSAAEPEPVQSLPVTKSPLANPPQVPEAPYDPYAGAALPPRR